MNRKELNQAFEKMTPDTLQKERMLVGIMENDNKRAVKERNQFTRHLPKIAAAAACMVLALTAVLFFPGGEGTVAFAVYNMAKDGTLVKMDDGHVREEMGTVMEQRLMGGFDFYIEGADIQSIVVTAKNEYIYVVDWTGTQEGAYDPNAEDEPRYEKQVELSFGEGFDAYEEIWYRWRAEDLYNWAYENPLERIYGYEEFLAIDLDSLTEEEKLHLAAADLTSMGHIILDDYPGDLEDEITITITDIYGNIATRIIRIKIDSNEINQTIVEAYVEK